MIKREYILNRQHEKWNDEEAPEADEDADCPTKERLRKYVTVANTSKRDDDVPYAVYHVWEILLRYLIQLRLKNTQQVSKNYCRDHQRVNEHSVRSLLHHALYCEQNICITSMNFAYSLRSLVAEQGQVQNHSECEEYANEAYREQKVIHLIDDGYVKIANVFGVLESLEEPERSQAVQEALPEEPFPEASILQWIILCVDLIANGTLQHQVVPNV